MSPSLRPLLAVLLVVFANPPAAAQEGHAHGDASPPANVQTALRAKAASEVFQIVAIARDGRLTLYLDRFAMNEPVVSALVDVETPDGTSPSQRRMTSIRWTRLGRFQQPRMRCSLPCQRARTSIF